MTSSEKEIILLLKRGDENAYRYLYETHYAILCRIAWEFVKDDFLSETIVGDTIFHLWEKRELLDIQTSLRAYLVRSVRNRCINYLKQEYVAKETRLQPTDDFLQSEGLYSISDDYPLATLLEKELEQKISQSIENLPDECRKVFEMSRFEHLKYLEIAEKLSISVNTVKYHIKNALSKISIDLNKYLITFLLFFHL
ncbi:MAG: RNA polymerase sigma-70 factor [Paludibacter sp.]|nr:RNA polymerase sigma-70 factor [Paludibacter sp.]